MRRSPTDPADTPSRTSWPIQYRNRYGIDHLRTLIAPVVAPSRHQGERDEPRRNGEAKTSIRGFSQISQKGRSAETERGPWQEPLESESQPLDLVLADQGSSKSDVADVADLYSNPLELPFSPVELRNLAVPGNRGEGLSAPAPYQAHELSKRLGNAKVEELVRRAKAGESVRSIARELRVANSALTRMLREEGLTISKRKVTDEEAAAIATEYEVGATMAELEEKYRLSHGAVLRSLHRSEVPMRAKAPRKSTKTRDTGQMIDA